MKKQEQPTGPSWRLICLLGALVISGCDAVGPDYKRPEVEVPAAYKSATSPDSAPAQLQPNWWTLFDDPELNELEAQAIKANYTIQAAMANVEQARAAARGVKSAFYPNISFDPSVIRSRTSANVAPAAGGGGAPSRNLTNTTFTAPFDLSYEVDLWGQVRRAVEASNAQVQFSQDEYEVVLQTLEADLAQDYFTLHFYDSQYATLTDSVDTFRKQLELTKTEFRAGLLGAADVSSAEAQLEATITQQVEASRQRQEEEYAIAVLLNRPPSAFSLPRSGIDGRAAGRPGRIAGGSPAPPAGCGRSGTKPRIRQRANWRRHVRILSPAHAHGRRGIRKSEGLEPSGLAKSHLVTRAERDTTAI